MEPDPLPLAADERDLEKALRARIGQFWTTAAGDPRTVYDTLISAAAPIADREFVTLSTDYKKEG